MPTAVCTFSLLLGLGLIFKALLLQSELSVVYFAGGLLISIAAIIGLIAISVANLKGIFLP